MAAEEVSGVVVECSAACLEKSEIKKFYLGLLGLKGLLTLSPPHTGFEVYYYLFALRWEGLGDVGPARYEQVQLPPTLTTKISWYYTIVSSYTALQVTWGERVIQLIIHRSYLNK